MFNTNVYLSPCVKQWFQCFYGFRESYLIKKNRCEPGCRHRPPQGIWFPRINLDPSYWKTIESPFENRGSYSWIFMESTVTMFWHEKTYLHIYIYIYNLYIYIHKYIYSIYSPNILDPSYWNTRPSVHDTLKTDRCWHPMTSQRFLQVLFVGQNFHERSIVGLLWKIPG